MLSTWLSLSDGEYHFRLSAVRQLSAHQVDLAL